MGEWAKKSVSILKHNRKDSKNSEKMDATGLSKIVAKDIFELGETFAFSQMAFDHLRFQARQYGGEFERGCLEIQDDIKKVSLGQKTDVAALGKEIVKVDLAIHRLQSRVVSVFLFGRSPPCFDTVG